MTEKMHKVKMAPERGNVQQAQQDFQKRLMVDAPEAKEFELERDPLVLTMSLRILANNFKIAFKILLVQMNGCLILLDQFLKNLASKDLALPKSFDSFSVQHPFQQTNVLNTHRICPSKISLNFLRIALQRKQLFFPTANQLINLQLTP